MKITQYVKFEKPTWREEQIDFTSEGQLYTYAIDRTIAGEYWKGKIWTEVTEMLPPPPRIAGDGIGRGNGKVMLKGKLLPLVYWSRDIASATWEQFSMNILTPPELGLVFDCELTGGEVTCAIANLVVGLKKVKATPLPEELAQHISSYLPAGSELGLLLKR